MRGCHVGNPAQLPVSPTNAVAAEVRYHMQRQGRRFSATHSAVLQLLDATGGRADPLDRVGAAAPYLGGGVTGRYS